MRSAAKGFQVRCTSAEDDDVTSIRFSARKAKTAAARTVGRVQRKERVKQREGRGGGHKQKHVSGYRQQSPGSRILEFGPREATAGRWTGTQRRLSRST